MALNYPNNPSLNEEWTDGNGVVWRYNGEMWRRRVSVLQGPPGPQGPAGPAGGYWDAVTGGINYSGGNVGIGVSLPQETLHVDGYVSFWPTGGGQTKFTSGYMSINHSNPGDAGCGYELISSADHNGYYAAWRDAGVNGNITFQNTGTGTYTLQMDGKNQLVIDENQMSFAARTDSVGVGFLLANGNPASGNTLIWRDETANGNAYYSNSGDGDIRFRPNQSDLIELDQTYGLTIRNQYAKTLRFTITSTPGNWWDLGRITFGTTDDSAVPGIGAQIKGILVDDGSWTESSHHCALQFQTVGVGSTTLTTRMGITPNGNVYIGNANKTTYKLEVLGDIRSSGNITAAGTCCSSDKKLKKNIYTIHDAQEILNAITGNRFDWIENDKPDMGIIAQELELVAPELVVEKEGIKTINYNGVIAILVEGYKSLDDRLTALENQA